ncbi:MAG: hypothetical protein WCK86_07910 [Planctomycetia bacterium]
MINEETLRRMVNAIYSLPETNGCIIGFHGNNSSRLLCAGNRSSANFYRCCIIIEEVEVRDSGMTASVRQLAAQPPTLAAAPRPPALVTNGSVIGRELRGAGISCVMTAVSAAGVIGGAAAEVPTGGASTFLLVAAWAGLTTSGLQCLNGLVRFGIAATDPDTNSLAQLDGNTMYAGTLLVVDGVGLASGIVGLPAAGRNLWAVISRQRAFAARRLSEQSLRQMNQQERLRVVSEVVEEASRTREGREAIITAVRQSGVDASSIQRTTGLSVRNATQVVDVLTRETTRRLQYSIAAVASVPASVVVSGLPSSVVGNASGSINWIVNVVYR